MKSCLKAIIVAVGLLAFSSAYASPLGSRADEELRDLHSKMVSLALIHNLELTPAQRGEIKLILTPLRPEIEALKEVEEEWHDKQMKKRLKDVISDLESGRKPGAPDGEALKKSEEMRLKRMDLISKTDGSFKQIKELLSEGQREKLFSFDPHDYIGFKPFFGRHPLRDMDPVQLIEKIRTAPDEEFDFMVRKIEKRMERRSKRGKDGMGPRGKGRGRGGRHDMRGMGEKRSGGQRVQALIDLMKKVRAIDQAEFDRQKERLQSDIGELMPAGRGGSGPDKGRRKDRMGRRGMDGPGPGGRGHGGHGFGGKKLKKLIVFSEEFYNAL